MRFTVGEVVAVTFCDHVEDGDDVIEFVAYGRVARVTRGAVSLDSWAYADPATPHDANVKRFTILRRAITGVRHLRGA